jgi:hypothetical protein
MAWFPAQYVPVSTTFEPEAFDFRYIPTFSTDSVLPSGYAGNFNESQLSVLLQQTAMPRTVIVPLSHFYNIPLVSESNRQILGQLINSFNFTNYPDQHGGILTLIQTVPAVNSISAYNPKLGFVEVKFHVDIYNSLV